jgi:hypothetical protein
MYFKSATPTYFSSADLRLGHTFTFSAWIRPEDSATVRTIFASTAYKTASTNTTQDHVLKFSILANHKLQLSIRKIDVTPFTDTKEKTSTAVTSEKWLLVGFSIQLKANAKQHNLKFMIDTTLEAAVDFDAGYYFI